MDTQALLNIAVPIGIGAGVIVVLAMLLYAGAKARVTATPTLQAVIDAIRPFILQGIWGAEQIALTAMDDLRISLSGADKKAIADSLYNLLPDSIYVGPVRLSTSAVKLLIPMATFEQLVETEFQQADAFITRNEAYLKKQVDALALPAAVPPPVVPPSQSLAPKPTIPDPSAPVANG